MTSMKERNKNFIHGFHLEGRKKMEPKYPRCIIDKSHRPFDGLDSCITKAIVIALVGAITVIGMYGCKKEALTEEDTLRSAPLVGKLYKQSKIAFQSYRDGNFEIYIMNADGSNQTRLTNNPAFDQYPSWSPDGEKITFMSQRDGDKNAEIYFINVDGSEETRLTDNPAFDAFPSWSPDGEKIAFASERDGNMNIYVMNTDGSLQARLTDNPAHDVKPQWSPDGKKIAFQTTRHGVEEVYVMNPDGSDQIRLTNNPRWDGCLSWSPDGKKIAFASNRDGNYEIYVMNADGSKQTRLTNNPAVEQAPFWSPDGKKIAFYSLRKDVPNENEYGKDERPWFECNAEIYVMNADGSEPTNLTNNPAYDGYPSWSPFLASEK